LAPAALRFIGKDGRCFSCGDMNRDRRVLTEREAENILREEEGVRNLPIPWFELGDRW